MERYRFLLKPAFFIFNLVFATWLVLKIEEIKPSDFGRYGSIFTPAGKLTHEKMQQKKYLNRLISEYKLGRLDSLELNKEIENYLAEPDIISLKAKK